MSGVAVIINDTVAPLQEDVERENEKIFGRTGDWGLFDLLICLDI